jgi:capsular exopolysaccharide synthesis family protein
VDSEPQPAYEDAERAPATDRVPFALVDADSPAIRRPLSGVTLHQDLVAALQPASPAAGRYRTLRERIETIEGGSPRQILAVTSPTRGDGKTLTGSNLALTMAKENDSRTLLIDAHLRRPRLHALFGLAREPGLIDVLIGRTPLDAALVTLADHRLHVLTAGTGSRQRSELLGSSAMQRLIEALRLRFDRIVIDPGSAESAELTALEPWIDGVLLVVRAGRTRGPDIDHALSRVATKLIGMVLNDSHSTIEGEHS